MTDPETRLPCGCRVEPMIMSRPDCEEHGWLGHHGSFAHDEAGATLRDRVARLLKPKNETL
jgi:hypothetical protein